MKIRPSVIIVNDDKVLLLKYLYESTEVYAIPGGNLEFGESLSETVVRELNEELNLEVSLLDFCGTAEIINEKQHGVHFFFLGKIISGEPKINPMETTANSVVWLNKEDISIVNLYPKIPDLVLSVLNGEKPHGEFLGKIDQPWY
jgi:ADP-ribose pyrophosphatase YjhB (NUDIX family)